MNVLMFLKGIGEILYGIFLFGLVFSPIVLLLLTICGQGHVIRKLFKNSRHSISNTHFNPNTDSSLNQNAADNNYSSSTNNIQSDLNWLSDIHNSPTYDNFPCNSSYDTIGANSWDK